MTTVTSLINSAYQQKTKVLTGKPRTIGADRKTDAVGYKKASSNMDKVDLKSGFSLERIQSLLTTEIGKKVDKMMADAGIDISTAAGLDWSPDATAGRIFNVTTGLFSVWKNQHQDMTEEELVNSFENVIRSSVDKGASQAMAILSASGVSDDVLSVSEKTMSVLHSKYDDFFDDLRPKSESEPEQESG